MDDITTSEAAELLGVSHRRVQQFVHDGRLQLTRKVRGAMLVDRRAVEALAKIPRPRGITRQPKGADDGS